MYLHICKDTIIKKENIIGIFKLSTIEKTKEYESIKQDLEKNKKLIDEANGDKKTFVLTKDKAYISNISAETLEKRAKSNV